MKKSLVFFLALVMVFSFATSAFAVEFNDIADQSQLVQDSIYKLAALNIVEGYENGGWQPNGNITRAEFAKIACLAGGYGDSYASLTNTASVFSDVKTGVWYTGWVNLAYSAGYIKGDGNGNFRPNDNISENEVITVLVRMLNYSDNLPGTWPVNYVRQAGVLGLLDDVSLTGTAPAKRSLVAVLASAVLDENMVVWSKDTDSFKPDENKSTLLAESFKGNTADGYVEQSKVDQNVSADTVTAGWKYADFDKGSMQVVFKNDKMTTDAKPVLVNGKALDAAMDVSADFQVSGGYSIYDLAGNYGSAIYTVKNDTKTLAFFDVKSSSFNAKDLEYSAAGKVKIDGKVYSVAPESKWYYADTEELIEKALVEDADLTGSQYLVYLDKDGKVYDILEQGKWATSTGIIDKVNTATGRLTYVSGASVGAPASSLKDKDVVVFKDGAVTKGLEALKAGDVVSVTALADNGADYAIVVLKANEGGVFSKAKGDTFTIGGTGYTVNKSAVYTVNGGDDYTGVFDKSNKVSTELTDQFGANASFVVGRNGNVIVLNVADKKAGSNVYGILLDYTTSGKVGGEKISSVKVFNQEGKTVTYDVVDDAYEDNKKDVTGLQNYATPATSLMKFKVNANGAISKALAVGVALEDKSPMVKDDEWVVEKDYKTMNSNEISDSVVAFNVVTKNDPKVIKSVSLVTKADLLKGDVAGGEGSCYVISSGKISAAMIVDFGRSSNGTYGIISDLGFADSDFDPAILFANGDKYELAVDESATKKDLVQYSVSGDKVTVEAILVNGGKTSDKGVVTSSFNTPVLDDITAITSSRIKNAQNSYKYTVDTKVYDYSDLNAPVELTSADIAGIDKNSFDLYVIANGKGTSAEPELELIVIVEKTK